MIEMKLCDRCGMCWKPVDSKCIRCGAGQDAPRSLCKKRAGAAIAAGMSLLAIVLSAVMLIASR